ncbi:MAG: fatty acyl-AMP ligase [Burkholderiales bacterium]|nr:fatty acyl-AMP ligase [Burkholderiales bacterium]
MNSTPQLIDIFRAHVARTPEMPAMTWVPERSQEQRENLSWLQLHDESERIAKGLLTLSWDTIHPRMLILAFSPGLDFIQAFLACQMAGIVAIPVAMPRRGRSAHILEAIVANCGAARTMTTSNEIARLKDVFDSSTTLATMQLFAIEELKNIGDAESGLNSPGTQDIAFIQYTSGSTSLPKGVVVTQANLMANLALIYKAFRMNPEFTMVSWLPHYHDMGLIGSLLTPIHAGIPCVSMAPSAFIKRPVRWLQIISEQDAGRSVMAGGPNFAYQLCIDRVAAEDIPALSLQRWKTAFNGAEPIRAQTIRGFAERFSDAGFSGKNILTCYGLAETTLFATGNHDPVVCAVSIFGLEQGHISPPISDDDTRLLVSSGHADSGRIRIVEAQSRRVLADGNVGEIWVSGPSVPSAYFRDETQSQSTFHAYIEGQPTPRFLVTGDIGAIVDGQLYVTGRSKELLIVNGRNIYPHDIEELIQHAVSGIEDVAVFAYDRADAKSESIVVFCELGRAARHLFSASDELFVSPELEQLALKIRVAVASAEITISHIRFVGPMGIHKTTSGKTSYGQNRLSYCALSDVIRKRPTSAECKNKE